LADQITASNPRRRRRGIRWHLFQVQLVAIVPIGLLAAALLYLHWRVQEHERERSQIESGESTSDRSAGGLGIGLTLVQRLAALHGGDVKASSGGRGQGATFTVRLPAAAPPPPPDDAERSHDTTAAGARGVHAAST